MLLRYFFSSQQQPHSNSYLQPCQESYSHKKLINAVNYLIDFQNLKIKLKIIDFVKFHRVKFLSGFKMSKKVGQREMVNVALTVFIAH